MVASAREKGGFVMLFLYLAVLLLALIGCKVTCKGFFAEESLSRNVTDSVKGIFILAVFFSHFKSYVTYTSLVDVAGARISLWLGQLIVACFLFYSGYGVCQAIERRGDVYVRAMPKNRILKTVLHFDLALLLFLPIYLWKTEPISLRTILLSLVGWESIGNSNWYIFVILALYAITWLSFTVIKGHLKLSALVSSVGTLLLIFFLHETKDSWWYDTTLCYVLGIWFSVYKQKILAFLCKSNLCWALSFLGVSALFFGLYYFTPTATLPRYARLLLLAPAFCLLVQVLLVKIRISNKVLVFLGGHLFEIYILQRLPMILFKDLGLDQVNLYLYFLACAVGTLLLSVAFRYAVSRLDARLFRGKKPS